jgi:hypothetical protein
MRFLALHECYTLPAPGYIAYALYDLVVVSDVREEHISASTLSIRQMVRFLKGFYFEFFLGSLRSTWRSLYARNRLCFW